jgi:hypothetical protein
MRASRLISILMTLQARGSVRQACVELLRFGTEADVLAPPELRARFAEVAAALHRRYVQ